MMRHLVDRIIPPAALRWGVLTRPGPVGWILATQRIANSTVGRCVGIGLVPYRRSLLDCIEAAALAEAEQRALEFDAAFEQVRQIMRTTGNEIADMQAKVEAFAASMRENSNRSSTGP